MVPLLRSHSRGGNRRTRANRSHWLLVVLILATLATPLYNRLEPRLFKLPFFYWSQLALVAITMIVNGIVYIATRKVDHDVEA